MRVILYSTLQRAFSLSQAITLIEVNLVIKMWLKDECTRFQLTADKRAMLVLLCVNVGPQHSPSWWVVQCGEVRVDILPEAHWRWSAALVSCKTHKHMQLD